MLITNNLIFDLSKKLPKKTLIGAKAKNLGKIIGLNIPVPQGFVISNLALEKFLRSQQISLTELNVKDITPEEISKHSQYIQNQIRSSRIPEQLFIQMKSQVGNKFGHAPIIVRSSAVGEDSVESSFAGQLDSIIVRNTELELENAILNCWASYWNEHNIRYQINRKSFLTGMGIVIQELVNSDVSGVLFTQNVSAASNSGDQDLLIAEFCYGLGEKIVQGQVTPGKIVIERDSSTCKITSLPEENGKNINQNIEKASWVARLAQFSIQLEDYFKCPQDIEWTVDVFGNLFILQSRPITTKEERKVIWSNANMNENYPDPVSPLLGSIAKKSYYHYFRNLGKSFGIPEKYLIETESALSNTVNLQAGRLYYNLTNIYTCIKLLPFSSELLIAWDSFIGIYEDFEEKGENPQKLNFISKSAFLLQVVFTTFNSFSFIDFRVKKFVALVNQHVQLFRRELNHRGKSHFKNEEDIHASFRRLYNAFKGFLRIRFEEWKNASLADAAALISYRLLNYTLEKIDDTNSLLGQQNTLLKGIPNIVSIEPSQKLWELSDHISKDEQLKNIFDTSDNTEILKIIREDKQYFEFNQKINEYLINWGFRCSGELMLTEPNYQEQPEALINVIKKYLVTAAPEPKQILKREVNNFNAVKKEISLHFHNKHNIITFFLKKNFLLLTLWVVHKSITYRELVRFKQSELYSVFRQTLLEIGDLLVYQGLLIPKEDIFFFEYPEILEFLDQLNEVDTKIKKIAKIRKFQHQKHMQMNPPKTLILKEGEHFDESSVNYETFTEENGDSHSMMLSGIPASAGKVSGKAKNLSSVFESEKIEMGDILVTRQTDPGWGPVFPLIKGLVLERGGMLSHGAIIAREFGIPAIVNVKNATKRIKSGQNISINGNDGTIYF